MEATAIQIGEGIHVIKTLVAVGHGGCGHLTHSGLRARFLLNLEKAPDTIDTHRGPLHHTRDGGGRAALHRGGSP
jgi:hypothetical protein